MRELPLKQKVAMMLPFLQRAGLVSSPPPCDVGPKLTRIIEAAGDRLKVAGDIIAYADFFFRDDFAYDPKDFERRLKAPGAAELLSKFRGKLEAVDHFEPAALEQALHGFVESEGIKPGDIIHAVRVAISGKGVGPGLYDCLAILGKDVALARIDRAIEASRSA
jgi:glutamyl-tRNA synthetase